LPILGIDRQVIGNGKRAIFNHCSSSDHRRQVDNVSEVCFCMIAKPVPAVLPVEFEPGVVQWIVERPSIKRVETTRVSGNRIHTMDFITGIEKPLAEAAPDKPRATSYENLLHFDLLSGKGC
jgi:hypothetical protein